MDNRFENLKQLKEVSKKIDNLYKSSIKKVNKDLNINTLRTEALNKIIDYLLDLNSLLDNEFLYIEIHDIVNDSKYPLIIRFNYRRNSSKESILSLKRDIFEINHLEDKRDIFLKDYSITVGEHKLICDLLLNWKEIKPIIEQKIEDFINSKIDESKENFVKYETEYNILSNFEI